MTMTLYRWVPKTFAEAAVKSGVIAHKEIPLWLFGMGHGQTYRPGHSITHNGIMLSFDLDVTATSKLMDEEHMINFSECTSEAGYPDKVIVKDNETGAYGVGRNRQHQSRVHVKARYSNLNEVGKFFGFNKIELNDKSNTDKYKPSGGWP